MKTKQMISWGLLAAFAGSVVAPTAALADKRQDKKNQWRNAAIGAGAVGVIGAVKGNKTAAILGAAGAAYSAKRYEDERKHQSQRKHARKRYHRSGNYTENGRRYYRYNGKMYYLDLKTGKRHVVG